MADLPLSCTCGTLRGTLRDVSAANHVVCHCIDCQTWMHHLGRPELLTEHGGSPIVQTVQSRVTFTDGVDQLQCKRLGPKGPLRFYAGCCNTPVANLAANPKMAFAGVSRHLLPEGTDLGPPVGLFARDAQGDRSTLDAHDKLPPVFMARAGLGMLVDRMLGRNRPDPFRNDDGTPVVEPVVLTKEERAAARP